MRSNQILMPILDNNASVPKVVNIDQIKFAQAGTPITVDQVQYDTTILTLLDNSQETALVDFEAYKNYFTVTDILIFDESLIPVQP